MAARGRAPPGAWRFSGFGLQGTPRKLQRLQLMEIILHVVLLGASTRNVGPPFPPNPIFNIAGSLVPRPNPRSNGNNLACCNGRRKPKPTLSSGGCGGRVQAQPPMSCLICTSFGDFGHAKLFPSTVPEMTMRRLQASVDKSSALASA